MKFDRHAVRDTIKSRCCCCLFHASRSIIPRERRISFGLAFVWQMMMFGTIFHCFRLYIVNRIIINLIIMTQRSHVYVKKRSSRLFDALWPFENDIIDSKARMKAFHQPFNIFRRSDLLWQMTSIVCEILKECIMHVCTFEMHFHDSIFCICSTRLRRIWVTYTILCHSIGCIIAKLDNDFDNNIVFSVVHSVNIMSITLKSCLSHDFKWLPSVWKIYSCAINSTSYIHSRLGQLVKIKWFMHFRSFETEIEDVKHNLGKKSCY